MGAVPGLSRENGLAETSNGSRAGDVGVNRPDNDETARFRGDIQGLRALAVLLVIAAHAGFQSAAGGFIGVDVFFVISGFLITGHLMREVQQTRAVSLAVFYARRARRILPAAILVLLTTCVAAVALLPFARSVEVLRDAVWAAGFGANVRFARVGTDYFAQGQPTSPLQHYWSLSVEEQYYVIWPLMIVILLWLHRRGLGGSPKQLLVLTLGVATVASLAWSVHATATSPATAYFSTFTRAWELGVGSLAAVIVFGHRRQLSRWLAELLPLVGLLAVLFSALTFTGSTPVPGWIMGVPVAGTVLILVAGTHTGHRQSFVGRALALRPARVLGDWSYSMYLWHFPVFKLMEEHLSTRRLTHTQALVAVIGIVVLSGLSYRFVEQPFRRGEWWTAKQWRALMLYPAGLALVLGAALGGRSYIDHVLGTDQDNPEISTSDYRGKQFDKEPRVAIVEASVIAAQAGRPVPSQLQPGILGLRQATAPLGDCDYRTGTRKLCPTGDSGADRAIVVIGDSHARAWGPALTQIGKDEHFVVYHLVMSGCSPNRAVVVDGATRRVRTECEEFKSWARGVVERLRPELVVVASSALGPVVAPDGSFVGFRSGRHQFIETLLAGFTQEIEGLRRSADSVAVIGNTPKLPRETGVCLSRRDVDLGDCLFSPDDLHGQIQRSLLRAGQRAGAVGVDAHRWFCANEKCPSVVGDTITMRDKEHVTPDYARELAPAIATALTLTP